MRRGARGGPDAPLRPVAARRAVPRGEHGPRRSSRSVAAHVHAAAHPREPGMAWPGV